MRIGYTIARDSIMRKERVTAGHCWDQISFVIQPASKGKCQLIDPAKSFFP